jgi:hypothetical protein
MGARGPFTGIVGFVRTCVTYGGRGKSRRFSRVGEPNTSKHDAPLCTWHMNMFKSSKEARQSAH